MLAVAGILVLVAAWAVFQWTLSRGVYRRYPYEQFVLVGASVLLGLAAVLERASFISVSLLLIEVAALAALTIYMTAGARFPRRTISLETGDRFPDFVLPDSEGNSFLSSRLAGKSVLYLFYRGPW